MSFISFDFFYRFSNIRQPWYVKQSKKERVKFCWLFSFVLMIIPVCLDFFTDLPLTYGSSRGLCFIQPQFYLIAFFIGPTILISAANLVCFVGTIINIVRLMPHDADISAVTDRNLAMVFAKIGGVMGVTWLFAILPSITGVEELWFAFILMNGLQGVYIFVSSGIIGKLKTELSLYQRSQTSVSENH